MAIMFTLIEGFKPAETMTDTARVPSFLALLSLSLYHHSVPFGVGVHREWMHWPSFEDLELYVEGLRKMDNQPIFCYEYSAIQAFVK